MSEKKMTLDELVRWLDDKKVPYGIDDAGKLTVKGDLTGRFWNWAKSYKYTSLPDELICIEGDLWLEDIPITSLGNLASVGGDLNLQNTSITSLGKLTSVGGNLNLRKTSITSLGKLTSVGGWFDLRDTSITSLGNLTSVGEFLDLKGAPIVSLGNLTSVGGWLGLEGVPITSLGNLTSVGGDIDLQGASVTSLDDLPQVGNELCLDESQFQLLTREVLQKVKGGIRHREQEDWFWGITLSPDELETIIAENERRERLHNVQRGTLLSDVDWALYDK